MSAVPAGFPLTSATSRMGPIARRLIYTLTLIPIVQALSVLGVRFVFEAFALSNDPFRWYHGFFASLWVFVMLLIWRSVIVWTLGRKALHAVISVVPFLQVLYPQPLWKSGGCMAGIGDGILRFGQHNIAIGVYVWLTIWVWWLFERTRMNDKNNGERPTAPLVSVMAARIVASIGSIPFVVGVYAIILFALEEFAGVTMWSPRGLSFGFWLSAAFAVAAWILIWRRAVAWSSTAIFQTAAATLVLIALPASGPLVFMRGGTSWMDIVLVWLPVIGWGVWMAWTVSVWPMRGTQKWEEMTPRCSRCDYLLTGLRATRCPECGDEPTLDELWRKTAGEFV